VVAWEGRDKRALVARQRHLHLFLVLSVSLAALLLIVISCAKGTPTDEVDTSGFVWVEDEWMAPPFVFEVADFQIRINGRIAKQFLPLTPEEDSRPIPETPENMSDLLEVAAQKFRDLGGIDVTMPSEAVISELTTFVESLPNVVNVRIESPYLTIMDRDGAEGALIIQDFAGDPPTDEEIMAGLRSDADKWETSLTEGSVILFQEGMAAEIPSNQVSTYLSELNRIYGLPATQRSEPVLDLVGDPLLAEALLERDSLPDFALNRVETASVDTAFLLAAFSKLPFMAIGPLTQRLDQRGPTATQGAHGENETPAVPKAWLFMPFSVESGGFCPAGSLVAEAAKLHNYQVLSYDGFASKIRRFMSSSGRAGILYLCMHGGNSFEVFYSREARDFMFGQLNGRALGLQMGRHPDPNRYYIIAGQRFIRENWESANSIVFNIGCNGARLWGAFSAREYIGTFEGIVPTAAWSRHRAFWGRLDGTRNDGKSRPVGTAFAESYTLGGPWQLFGTGNGHTVLSPAVSSMNPRQSVPISPTVPIEGQVKFDAEMFQTPNVRHVVKLSGCGAQLVDAEWGADPYTFDFSFTTTRPGTLTIKVDHTFAVSNYVVRDWIRLDGNQNPPRKEHVGPNEDDEVVTLECVADPTETPTSETLPPPDTPTPTSTPDPTATPASTTPTPTRTSTSPSEPPTTPTATVTRTPTPTVGLLPGPDGITIEVLEIGGLHYPASQIYLSPGHVRDARCTEYHWHALFDFPPLSLEYPESATEDPDRDGCGYGTLADLPRKKFQVARDVYEAFCSTYESVTPSNRSTQTRYECQDLLR
jgi:hypothetical protein